MSESQWHNAKIVDIIKETHNIRRFFLKFEELDKYDFIAGQYVKIEFPIPSKKNYRQYSIASNPNGTNIMELLIVLDPNGLATNYLFNQADIGTTLKVSKNMGNFIIKDTNFKEFVFISTGTGLAPLRSMYLDLLKREDFNSKITVIFGTRYMKDMIYLDEFQELSKDPRFKFIPILSREISQDWKGQKGYVHNIYKELYLQNNTHSDDTIFYICGWKDMVTETRHNLLSMGFERKLVNFERYN